MPFYGYNRPGAKISQGIRDNWWRQGMMGGIKAHVEGIKALSETDFSEDLKSVDSPCWYCTEKMIRSFHFRSVVQKL
jgi:non-heme chloroperoxidase